MDDSRSSITSTLVSAGAFLLLALGLGVAAWWLYSIMFMTVESADQYGVRVSGRAARATVGMGAMAICAAFGSLFFAAVSVATLWLGVTKFRAKPPRADDSWKNLPYPKG